MSLGWRRREGDSDGGVQAVRSRHRQARAARDRQRRLELTAARWRARGAPTWEAGGLTYHPACYEPAGGRLPSSDGARLFAEALGGVDGGEGSFAAVEQAAELVGPGGRLTVLIATKLRTGTGQMPGDSATEMSIARTRSPTRRGSRAGSRSTRPGLCTRSSATGPASRSGRDRRAAQVGPRGEALFGGVTDTAMRSLSTPLLVARPVRAAARFGERVLVASDGLGGSDELVALARRMAGDGRSALTLIHALGRRSVSRRSRIDAQVQSIQPDGADGDRAVIESGSAEETIIAACSRLDASLVVMSSRRRAGLSVLGSVSRRVVHHGGCSVLLVPPDWLAQGDAATAESA